MNRLEESWSESKETRRLFDLIVSHGGMTGCFFVNRALADYAGKLAKDSRFWGWFLAEGDPEQARMQFERQAQPRRLGRAFREGAPGLNFPAFGITFANVD